MPAIPLTEPHPRPAYAASSDLRSEIRNATASAHVRLDALFGQCNLQILPGYRGFLEAHAAAVLPLEAALTRSGVDRLFPDWRSRSRSRALAADLISLGGQISPVPALPRLDFGGVLGTMYVLEGSRLGARFLLARVEQSRDPVVAGTTAYLGHGSGSQLWRSFLDLLEQHGANLSDPAKAIEAARRTFGLFERAAAGLAGCEAAHS
jgi:heme oxygenase